MKIKLLIAVVLFVGLAVLGASDINKRQEKMQFQEVQLKSRATEIKKLETDYDLLNKKVEQNKGNESRIKELEAEREQLKKREEELQRQVQAKAAERARLAEAAKKVQDTATQTKTATASPGSGCAWLSGVLQQHGISGADLTAALNIAERESGCRQAAVNKSGGACNVFQELPCGKWGGSGNLSGHISGANNYAKSRYGGWQGAWSAWQAKHWW